VSAGTMEFDVISLFPEAFVAVTGSGITRRAKERGLYGLKLWNPRDFTIDAHRTVDDRPYGGGPGMVMMAEPMEQAIRAARARQREALGEAGVPIHLTPAGRPLNHAKVLDLAGRRGRELWKKGIGGGQRRQAKRHWRGRFCNRRVNRRDIETIHPVGLWRVRGDGGGHPNAGGRIAGNDVFTVCVARRRALQQVVGQGRRGALAKGRLFGRWRFGRAGA